MVNISECLMKIKNNIKKILKTFYTHFTGKNTYNDWNNGGNKKFSDIPLTDFHSSELCKNKNSDWNKTFVGKKEGLFKKYAENLNKMMNVADKNQKNILQILDQIFLWEKKNTRICE